MYTNVQASQPKLFHNPAWETSLLTKRRMFGTLKLIPARTLPHIVTFLRSNLAALISNLHFPGENAVLPHKDGFCL